MSVTLVIPFDIAHRLRGLALDSVEAGGVLLARMVVPDEGDNTRLLVRELHEVPKDAYEYRGARQLRVSSGGYVPALSRAEEVGCVPIWFHTHPRLEASASRSKSDLVVDQLLCSVFRLRSGSHYYGSLVVAPDTDGIRFTGDLDDGSKVSVIDYVWVVGSRLALYGNEESDTRTVHPMYDRNVRAFGGPIQATLSNLRVAIVGCGGTGSSVAEQLCLPTKWGMLHFPQVC